MQSRKFLFIILFTIIAGCNNFKSDTGRFLKKEQADNVADLREMLLNTTTLESFGKVQSKTHLVLLLGEERIAEGERWYDEGTVTRTFTKLYPGTPDEIEIIWNSESGTISTIRASDPGGKWKLKNGIYLGMPLDELNAKNMKPVKFWGFGWDHSGLVDFNHGALTNGHYSVYLNVDEAYWNHPNYQKFLGDGLFVSGVDEINALKPFVGDIVIHCE